MTDDFARSFEAALRSRSWPALMAATEAWSDGPARDAAVAQAARAIDAWDDRERVIPVEVWRRVAEGAEPPPWWPLARHVALGEHDTLDPLDRAPHLTSIELVDPSVPLDPLLGLSGLRNLEITGSIDQWSVVTQLAHLESFASHGSPTVDLDDRLLPATLRDLTIDGSPLQDTRAFVSLTGLRTLRLDANDQLRDLAGLAGLRELVDVTISRCPVDNLAPLSSLTRLENLVVTRVAADDVAPLGSLAQLPALTLGSRRLRDLSPLAQLAQLEHLRLEESAVSDLAPLGALGRLEFLSLAYLRELSDLGPIAQLPALARLHLIELPKVRDASPLAALPRLRELIVERTPLGDLAALDALRLGRLIVDGVERATGR